MDYWHQQRRHVDVGWNDMLCKSASWFELVICLLSSALFYQSTLLARPLIVPHKYQEQPYMLTARIHASQALYGQYQQGEICNSVYKKKKSCFFECSMYRKYGEQDNHNLDHDMPQTTWSQSEINTSDSFIVLTSKATLSTFVSTEFQQCYKIVSIQSNHQGQSISAWYQCHVCDSDLLIWSKSSALYSAGFLFFPF